MALCMLSAGIRVKSCQPGGNVVAVFKPGDTSKNGDGWDEISTFRLHPHDQLLAMW